MPHGSVDRRPDTVFLGHVRRDRDAIPGGLGHDLRGLLARLSVDFGDNDFAPSAAIARAVARPMPVPAPVISAILPSSRAIAKLPTGSVPG